MGRLIGYGRVFTDEQNIASQKQALEAVPCDLLFLEDGSGADTTRPELARALRAVKRGDTLVVVRLERLGRSLLHLLEIIEDLKARGVGFRSLAEGLDLSTSQGRLMMQQLGAFAEFERHRIIERVNGGIAAAKRRGVAFGNPGLVAGNKAAIKKLAAGRRAARTRRLVDAMESFMPTVRRLRPHTPWREVAKALSAESGEKWTVERLLRSVHGLAVEGRAFVDTALLGRSPRPRKCRRDELAALVQGMRMLQPKISIRQIAVQLETMGQRTPRGHRHWSTRSVQLLLNAVPPAS